MTGRLAILTVCLLAMTACKHNKRATTTVGNRAAFDFPCSQSDLTLTVLDTEGARKMASQIGVHGCGKKAVYVYYPDSDTWLLDGTVSEAPEGYQARAHVTEGDDQNRSDKKSAKQATKAEKRGDMAPVEQTSAEELTPEPSVPSAPEPATPEGAAPVPD